MDEVRELKTRLDRLEQRHRRLQLILTLIVIAVSSILLMGQTPLREPTKQEGTLKGADRPRETSIRAESFVLTDEKGNERASLVTDGNGSVFFVMFDKNGKPRADMQVNNYGPSINFYDPNNKTRVALGSTTLVASHVNTNGVVERNTPSSIVMFDAAGQLVWRTP